MMRTLFTRKHFSALLTAGIVLFLATAVSAASWTGKANMLRKRGEFGNFVYKGEIYIMGGIHNHTSGPAQIEKYNPSTNKWTHVGTMSFQRHHFTCGSTVYGDEVWVCGGKLNDRSFTKRVDVYNVKNNTWRRGPDLPAVHWGGPAVVAGDELHVLTGGGSSNGATTDHHYVLNLKNESAGWKSETRVPLPRVHAAAVHLNGKIYVVAGEYHHTHDGDTRAMQVYNPSNNSWDTGKAQIPEARSHHDWGTFVHNGEIWCVSGVNSANTPRGQNTVYVYNPGSNTWTKKQDLWAKLVSPGARIINNTLYVYGGGVNDWFDGTMTTTRALSIGTPAPAYTLSVTKGTGDGSYTAGTKVTIKADAPGTSQAFDKWTGSSSIADVNASTTTITMPSANTTVTATYKTVVTYKLTVNGGSGDGNYQAGAKVTVKADAAASGKAFDKWTGDVSGLSSTTSATATYTIGTSAATITATYKDVPDGQYAYGGTPHAVPGRIEAEHFDEGGQGVSWYDKTNGNQTGLLRDTDVDIYATDDGTNQHKVGYNAGDEWLEYTINAQAGTYTIKLRVATPKTDGTAPVTINGKKVGTLTIPKTGDWDTFQTIELKNIQINGGEQVVKIEILGSGWDFNWFELEKTGGTTRIADSFISDDMVKLHFNAADRALHVRTVNGGECLVRVSDASGNRVARKRIYRSGMIPLGSDIRGGICFLTLETGGKQLVRKFYLPLN